MKKVTTKKATVTVKTQNLVAFEMIQGTKDTAKFYIKLFYVNGTEGLLIGSFKSADEAQAIGEALLA